MKKNLLFFLMVSAMVSKAQSVVVSGPQSGIWEADTVRVAGDVMVMDSLVISAGTTVLFEGYHSICVTGGARLMARGTEADSVLFTVADTTGFHVFNSGRGGWNGIQMKNAGASWFDYCRFQYGKAALDDSQDGGALRITDCDKVEIKHSTLYCNFSREHGGALNAEHSTVSLNGCYVSNNLTYSEIDTIYFMYGGGLRFINCDVELTEVAFRGNYGASAIGGALSTDSCTIAIDRCIFENNYGVNGAGLYMMRSYDRPCSITNSLFANNTSEHFGGGLAISDASPEISNITVVGNHSVGVNCGGIFFYQKSSPVVNNCIVYGNTNNVPLEEPVQMWCWTYEDHVPQFHNCLIQYGLENISNHESITIYKNCIDEAPLFVDAESMNFRLAATSPCIDAGLASTPEHIINGLDLDGNERLVGNAIDMGAYEFFATSIPEVGQNHAALRILGNPISETSYAEITLEAAMPVRVEVFSIEGKRLVNNDLGCFSAGICRIPIGKWLLPLPKATYLVVVRTQQSQYVGKVVR